MIDEECEALIQLACIAWMAFKKQFQTLKTIKENKVRKILKNNLHMKQLVETEGDRGKFIETALKNYPEHEMLGFIHSALNGRWQPVIRDERSANVLFYTLKTIVDCLVISRSPSK